MYTLCLFCTHLPHTLHQLKNRFPIIKTLTTIMHLPVQKDCLIPYRALPPITDTRYVRSKLHVVSLLNSRPIETIPKERFLLLFAIGCVVPIQGQSSSSSLPLCRRNELVKHQETPKVKDHNIKNTGMLDFGVYLQALFRFRQGVLCLERIHNMCMQMTDSPHVLTPLTNKV